MTPGELTHGDRRALATHVDADDLARDEQETWLTFQGTADRFTMGSYVPSIARQLLQHDLAEIQWVYVGAPDERRRREENITELLGTEDAYWIEGISVTLPLGALSIKGSPRSRNIPSAVVTTPADLNGLAEAFSNPEGRGAE